MKIQTRTAIAVLAGLGALSGLLLADLPQVAEIPALMPAEEVAPSSASLPIALQELLGERQPTSGPVRVEAEQLARAIAASFETQPSNVQSTSAPRSYWERLHPEIDRRFAAMAGTERRANIAFVHFLVRNGLEPGSLSDESLAGAYDELAALYARRNGELHAIQYEDTGNGAPEQIMSEEVDDLSMEVMDRYRELERELGYHYGGTDQRSTGAAAFASAASSR